MSVQTDIMTLEWSDSTGQPVATTYRCIPVGVTGSPFASLDAQKTALIAGVNKLVSLSVAKLNTAKLEYSLVPAAGGSGDTGDYSFRSQLLKLDFQTVLGNGFSVIGPCPEEVIILPGDVVDETNASVVDFIAWVIAYLCDADGNLFAEFIGGAVIAV